MAVLSQTLVPRADGSGRIAAIEIMLGNTAVRSLIREGKIYQLSNAMRSYRNIGMMTLDESLVNLYTKRIIDAKTLFAYCADSEEVEKLLKSR